MPRFDAGATSAAIRTALEKLGRPDYSEGAKRYLKSDLTFFGTRSPDVRATVRSFAREHPHLTRAQLIGVTKALWAEPIHETRLAAVQLLEERPGLLEARDVTLLERLIRESRTWAYVDPLAINVGGEMWVAGTLTPAVLDRWANDDDFWIRRSSMLVLLKPAKAGNRKDFERFAGYADAMLEEEEFFIRKAIGWVLREVSKKDPDKVRVWVEPRLDRMSGVTRREAIKYLPTVRPRRPSRR
jgi:3-methyladenine DNA glycosylase AlkD